MWLLYALYYLLCIKWIYNYTSSVYPFQRTVVRSRHKKGVVIADTFVSLSSLKADIIRAQLYWNPGTVE